MRDVLLTLALALAACSPLETTEAVCMPDGVHCPGADRCGVWVEACDSPEACPDGVSERVYIGNTRPLSCEGGRPTCPDGSETFCVYIPDTGPVAAPECNAPASLCDL